MSLCVCVCVCEKFPFSLRVGLQVYTIDQKASQTIGQDCRLNAPWIQLLPYSQDMLHSLTEAGVRLNEPPPISLISNYISISALGNLYSFKIQKTLKSEASTNFFQSHCGSNESWSYCNSRGSFMNPVI